MLSFFHAKAMMFLGPTPDQCPEHKLTASDSSDTIFILITSNSKALSITPPHGVREVGRGIVYCGEVGVLVENRPNSKN
jgi:hypothetical protein